MTVKAAPKVLGAHHVAYRARNAEETRAFYEDILGLPLATVVRDRAGPEDQGGKEFLHLFFQMADGNFIAFFVVDEDPPEKIWRMKDGIRDYHYAMEVEDMDQLMAFKARLEEAAVPVFGPIDHEFVHSIYFWDPNGVALEFTTRDPNYDTIISHHGGEAHDMIRIWTSQKG